MPKRVIPIMDTVRPKMLPPLALFEVDDVLSS